MKFRLFAQILAGLVLSCGTTIDLTQPSLAQNTTFFCRRSNGVPVTFARTPRGNVPIIRWVSNSYFPPPWTPQRRCEEVARRFQTNRNNGTLRFITTGTLRGEPVVCAASNKGDSCTGSTLLFTLKRGSNPNAALRRLLDVRGLAGGNVLNESGGDDWMYVDVDDYLNAVPLEENGN